MTSFQWADLINPTLKRRHCKEINPDQLAEIEELIASAMQDAWERGQEYDRGLGFSNDRMED